MTVENPTYISDLNSNYPADPDLRSEGAAHIRNNKKAMKNTFPNIVGSTPVSHVQLNELANLSGGLAALVPRGLIVMWSNVDGKPVPAGWQLCDGTNGTPDLRDRFIVGSGTTYAIGATGGSTNKTVSSTANGTHSHSTGTAGAHTHGGSTASHVLTVSQIPSHTHGLSTGEATGGNAPAHLASAARVATNQSDSIGGGQGHSHGISSDGNHTHTVSTVTDHTHSVTVDVRPSYYALALIMKL